MRAAVALCLALAAAPAAAEPEVRIGSKSFTESVILGEMVTHLARATGAEVLHQRELGGTQVLWQALLAGELDAYVEYTGTLRHETLARALAAGGAEASLESLLAAADVRMSASLGFNDTYALGMRADEAARLGVRRISDLARHPALRLRFANEFMERNDGWPGLQRAYGLPHTDVLGLDHDLAYRGLEAGAVDVMDCYSTDAEIQHYGLVVLEDDRGYFPRYEGVIVYRGDLAARAPAVVASFLRLEGRIDAAQMRAMNARTRLDKVPEARVAADFLQRELGVEVTVAADTVWTRLARHTADHLVLVGVSLAAAILVAIPLGVLAAARPRLGRVVLGTVGVIQTLPSLALLVVMIPLLGIGSAPAIAALFLYSLLPIVRNTHAGLRGIPAPLRASAEALGLPRGARLRRIELPLAAGSILAGIKTSAVINVGTATLGALVGAGGYGQPILTGIRLDDVGLILEGAVPAAVLALLAQGLFELAERWFLPAGLREVGR